MNHPPKTPTQPKPSRWHISASLARSAWRVVKLDRSLLWMPVVSIFGTLAIIALVVFIVLATSASGNLGEALTTASAPQGGSAEITFSGPLLTWSPLSIAFYVVVYLLLSFVGTFFSAALIAGLLERFRGGSPTISSALRAARKHIGSLFAFSTLSASIGIVLNLIEDRVPLGGKIATWLVGAAWAIASMFALPVIVTAKTPIGPLRATRQSMKIIKNTWGESVIVNGGIGIVALISIVMFILGSTAIGLLAAYLVSAFSLAAPVVALGASLLIIVALLALIVVLAMLSAAAKAAIYHYATSGETPAHFEQQILRASFTTSDARKVFSA